jgi:hypothetical protein
MVDEPAPFRPCDVLWVESPEYPPSLAGGWGYEFWVTRSPIPARSPGFWLVDGWELAAGTQELVRYRTICVPAETPRARWQAQPPAPYRDAADGWTQPTQALPIATLGEQVRRGVVGSAPRPLMTPLARQRAAPLPGAPTTYGRHARR